MDEYAYDKGLYKRIKRLIKKFPDSFGHIEPDHVLTLRSDKEGYKAIAEVRQIPNQLYGIMPYRVMMIVYSERYDHLKKNIRNLVDVHELTHIGEFNDRTERYRLIRHDVEDWSHMVGLLGVGWTQSTTIDIMKATGSDWQESLEELVLKEYRKKKKRRRK